MRKLQVAILISALTGLSVLTGCATFIEKTTYQTDHKAGDIATGKVFGVYTTLEQKRNKMIGFDKQVPQQYQNETWANIRFHNYAYLVINYALVIVPSGMSVKEGDTVEVSLGRQKPDFVPNRIVRVLSHAQ